MTAPTDPQQTDPASGETPPEGTADPGAETKPGRWRRAPSWLLVVAGAVAAIAVMVLLRGGEEAAAPRDLSTPEGAAEAFARAAAAGDVDGVLAVTCLGDPGCAAEHGDDVTPEQVSAAKKVIADHVREIGARFGRAEFTTARAGAEPGTREVDYRLPGMPENERNYLVLVEYDDRWLYLATGHVPA